MNEALLHTIWKYRLLGRKHFTGTRGEDIHVISVGEHNHDSGPDFFNAKVSINNIVLAGNVEIHVNTSDWLRHDHQYDKAYNNLVLHVVYEHDTTLMQNEQFNVSVLELKPLITEPLIHAYQQLELSKQLIPCGKSISSVPSGQWTSWLDQLVIKRLSRKATDIRHLFDYTGHDLEETLYVQLCCNFGFKINQDAFALLARSLPYKILKKYADDVLRLEALLFGMAGLLDEPFNDTYPRLLQNEFELLKQKHKLIPLHREVWKFSKTRPLNFPTIRLSQLAQLFAQSRSLYHLLEEYPSSRMLRGFFQVATHDYWETHFRFDVSSQKAAKPLGKMAVDSLLINTVSPFLFFCYTRNGHQPLKDYVIGLLREVDAESNRKTTPFKELGMKATNALESQAQTELYDALCSGKGCLRCNVAEFLLKASV